MCRNGPFDCLWKTDQNGGSATLLRCTGTVDLILDLFRIGKRFDSLPPQTSSCVSRLRIFGSNDARSLRSNFEFPRHTPMHIPAPEHCGLVCTVFPFVPISTGERKKGMYDVLFFDGGPSMGFQFRRPAGVHDVAANCPQHVQHDLRTSVLGAGTKQQRMFGYR